MNKIKRPIRVSEEPGINEKGTNKNTRESNLEIFLCILLQNSIYRYKIHFSFCRYCILNFNNYFNFLYFFSNLIWEFCIGSWLLPWYITK